MKILIINHFPLEGSGSGVYTKNLAKELTEIGHKVKVIFPENRKVPREIFEMRPIIFRGADRKIMKLILIFPVLPAIPGAIPLFIN